MKQLLFSTIIFLCSISARSQVFKDGIITPKTCESEPTSGGQEFIDSANGRVNLFIFTRERNKKIDLLAFYTLLRARVKSLFHSNKLYVINARSSQDATAKVERILHKKNKLIKNLWFDSHGHYGNGYSSFRVGADQFHYKNIHDAATISHLKILSKYCDKNTKVGLGACCAGADYYFPSTNSAPVTRMNGDSLMIGIGDIFEKSSIYASESWVMAKPGIFKNKFGLAGYPLQKRFKDSIYAPVWERIGKWKKYSKDEGEVKSVATISLDRKGNINTRYRDYNKFNKSKKMIAKALKNLKPALAKSNGN